jgi:NDP-sugar pyrophosphorylase family protein
MQALVLVGGFGTRMRPLTFRVPKAMLPIAHIPFIERFVEYLEANGITHIVFAMGYLPDPIKDYMSGTKRKAELSFVVEDRPLDTGGAIKNAEPLLGERFFVFNGDLLTTIPLSPLLSAHEQKNALITIAMTPVDDPSRYGVIVTDEDGRVKAFIEKPPREEAPSNLINAGIYIYEREVLDHIPPKEPYSVERGLYPKLLSLGIPFYAVPFPNDYWLDIGKVEHYLQANFDILSGKAPLPIPGREILPGIWANGEVRIAPTAILHPPVLLGDGCVVGDGARIGPFVILGKEAVIGEGAIVQESVLWDECVVGRGSALSGCVLGNGCEVRDGISLPPGSAYGCGERIE